MQAATTDRQLFIRIAAATAKGYLLPEVALRQNRNRIRGASELTSEV